MWTKFYSFWLPPLEWTMMKILQQSIFCHLIPFCLVFKVMKQFSLNILWFPSDYSTSTSCYYCSQSPHQTENFLNFPTLRKSVDLTTRYFKRCVLSFIFTVLPCNHSTFSFLVPLFDLLEIQLHCKYIQFKCSESVVKNWKL